jgi:flagellar hook protein FlgE
MKKISGKYYFYLNYYMILGNDGTKGNPRIRVQHATKTRVDINTKGDVAVQTGPNGNVWFGTNGLFAIDADGNLIIQGDVKITGNLEVFGDLGITATFGPIIAKSSQIQDFLSTLASLRETFNAHTHSQGSDSDGDCQQDTDPPDPDPHLHVQPPFVWEGHPK